jgi:hypothetical protein
MVEGSNPSSEQQEKAVKRIEKVLNTDNVFSPEENPQEKAKELFQTLFQSTGETVPFSSRRYGMRTIDEEGNSFIAVYEKGNNFYPDEIVDRIKVSSDEKNDD